MNSPKIIPVKASVAVTTEAQKIVPKTCYSDDYENFRCLGTIRHGRVLFSQKELHSFCLNAEIP